MKILFSKFGWEDYLYWQEKDRKTLLRINDLIKDIQRNPFGGLGKPEALRFEKKGYWSRRIDHEHRLVYKIEGDNICIAQCRYHY
jgi:toxin YoeB